MTGSEGDIAKLLDGPALADGAAGFLAGGAAGFGGDAGTALGACAVSCVDGVFEIAYGFSKSSRGCFHGRSSELIQIVSPEFTRCLDRWRGRKLGSGWPICRSTGHRLHRQPCIVRWYTPSWQAH